MAESLVYELRDVGYAYPQGDAALQGISLEIRKGERVALLGSNGSGKSTLLRLLDGLLLPDRGEIRAYGVPLTDASLQDVQFSRAFRQRVGFIFQRSDVQLFSPTVWDEIGFGPLQLGLSAVEVCERVEDVIEMLGLDALRDRAPYQLSGGEQKKVAIACVLSMNPEVLLLDEPTAALDPRTQLWFIELIHRLQEAGKTTILATHDLDLLPQLADRAVVLGDDHTVQRDAPTSAVLSDHDLLHAANLAHHHLPGHPPAHRHPPLLEPTPIPPAHQHPDPAS